MFGTKALFLLIALTCSEAYNSYSEFTRATCRDFRASTPGGGDGNIHGPPSQIDPTNVFDIAVDKVGEGETATYTIKVYVTDTQYGSLAGWMMQVRSNGSLNLENTPPLGTLGDYDSGIGAGITCPREPGVDMESSTVINTGVHRNGYYNNATSTPDITYLTYSWTLQAFENDVVVTDLPVCAKVVMTFMAKSEDVRVWWHAVESPCIVSSIDGVVVDCGLDERCT